MLNLLDYGLDIDSAKLKLLESHLRFVLDYNQKVQLTAIREFDEGVLLHIVDSLMSIDTLSNLLPGDVLDMGSGGGFPGIPLAICTERKVDLLDSVKKKMRALEVFINETGLTESVSVHDVRAEELARTHSGRYSVVTARALSSLPSLLELASPLLATGGSLIAYKGNPAAEELQRAHKIAPMVGMKFVSRVDYLLPTTDNKRTLLVYTKSRVSKIKLPRRTGLAQKSPLA